MDLKAETWIERGRKWRRIVHEAAERWVVGVDLGCSVDRTAIAILRHSRTPLETFKVTEPGRNTIGVIEQEVETRYDVLHLERLEIGTVYPAQVQHIKNVLERPPLRHVAAELVIDTSGVGLPVAHMAEEAGLKPVKVIITAGLDQTKVKTRLWHVSKSLIVSHIDAALSSGEFKIAPELRDAPALKDELANFERHVGAAGRATYAARANAHDDLVMAIGVALWWAMKPKPNVTIGAAKGLY